MCGKSRYSGENSNGTVYPGGFFRKKGNTFRGISSAESLMETVSVYACDSSKEYVGNVCSKYPRIRFKFLLANVDAAAKRTRSPVAL